MAKPINAAEFKKAKNPCKHCGGVDRYIGNGTCPCYHKNRQKNMTEDERKIKYKKNAEWAEKNKEKVKASAWRARSKKRYGTVFDRKKTNARRDLEEKRMLKELGAI